MNAIDGFQCLTPKGSFYVFPSYDFKMSSRDLGMKILENGVICTPGRAFGPAGEGHLRFSFANTMESIEKGMSIVQKVANELR